MEAEPTRKRFLQIAGAAGLALLSVPGCGASRRTREAGMLRTVPPGPYARTFRSRPDLAPPAIEVTTPARDTASGYIFATPAKGPGQHGAMILDELEQTVWFEHSPDRQIRDFRAQRYRGKPVLTWWEGRVSSTRGLGEYVVLDDSYREMVRLPAGNGYSGDLHEFLITSRDTALATIYRRVREDLSSLGGAEDAAVLEGIVQELDPETGEVIFEWRSLEHVGLGESYVGAPGDPEADFDYFHLNSIEVDADDNLLISARNTWAVYKIDRETGEVLWRLGGKMSDFEMGPGTGLAYQHDARRQSDGTITIFDNGAAPKVHERSRGIVVDVDLEAMKTSLVREYVHPGETLLAGYLGNMQTLESGNVFVGWGSEPFLSEFDRDGELLFDAKLPPDYMSYRSYRLEWEGYPTDRPAMVAERRPGGEVTLYASWNGATEVAEWEVLAGPAPERLRSVATAPREDFETSTSVRPGEPYVAVRARDRSGRELGVSETVELPG